MTDEPIWSSTDYPYACLRDSERTLAFRKAIEAAVRPGDVVVEIGAGTGILSFFAATFGASRVVAVEIDGFLSRCLRRSVAANNLDDVVEILEVDAMNATLPRADVLICELIDTGLFDEQQIPVINRLHSDGVIDANTCLIPAAYSTRVQLVWAQSTYYGIEVLSPKHLWPFYDEGNWAPSAIEGRSESIDLRRDDFRHQAAQDLSDEVTFAEVTGPFNAIRISGVVELSPSQSLLATPALNGDKVIFFDEPIPLSVGRSVTIRFQGSRGRGLATVELEVVAPGKTKY